MSGPRTAPTPVVVGPDHPALSGRTGAGVRIAVLDSGIHAGHPHVGGLAGAVAVDDQGAFHDDWVDRLGHGTAVAAAIHEKAPGAALHVVKVFDGTLSTRVPALLRALEWAVENGARLINLSLGTARPEHAWALAEAVASARARGCLVVSARAHRDVPWFPGSLPGAVGVVADAACPREAVRFDPTGEDGATVVRASPYPRPIPGVPPERNLNGVSFAVANVTGVLARALEGRPEPRTPEEVLRLLTG